MKPAYKITVYGNRRIVDPDGIYVPTLNLIGGRSFYDEGDAQDLVDLLNDAYEKGIKDGKQKSIRPAQEADRY